MKGAVRGPTVSPDGKWLYYADSGRGVDQLYRVDLAGGKPEPLSDDVFSISGISPDGSQLIGTSWIETEKRFALGVIPAAKGSIRRIDHPPNARSATFAPDGQSVIYLARGNLAQLRIYRQSLRGGAPVLLGELPDVVFAWDWSADGTRVVLSRGTARSDVVLLSRRNE